MSLVGAMCAGPDSIEDADRLRHGAMERLFGEVRGLDAGDTPTRVHPRS
ncbi:hypothetical protein ACFYZJ_17930 [Streptomyces sp. NPDC001848]